jgi:hypothetical protein
MLEDKKQTIDQRLRNNPVLRKRLESILDIAENIHGEFATGHLWVCIGLLRR